MTARAMTAADVSRLLGRAAFGATAADLDLWAGREYDHLVEELLAANTHPAALPLPDDAIRLKLENDTDTTSRTTVAARGWWLERMRTTPFPLVEKMTLFWHGHFATAVNNPPFPQDLVRQNQTLRANALGNFRTMVAQMTIDPAMLYWLSGTHNRVPSPNENYAREFFELFTLGKSPQVYSERDIRQAARAFTGWYLDGTGVPVFAMDRHDKGSKRILGRTVKNLGDKEYLQLVDIALDHGMSYRFIAWKLIANFGYVPPRNVYKTSDKLVGKVAQALRSNDWDIAAGVRALLLADEFRYANPGAGRQLVRQPVECVVHAAKVFGVRADDPALLAALDGMGQSLFAPVNVGGWPLGAEWVSPVTAIARYDAGLAIHRLATTVPGVAETFPQPGDLAGWAKRLGLAGFGQNTKNAVSNYLRRSGGAPVADRQTGVLALLLSSPEWAVM
ncbi:MAG TPA: DUF1800 domain-containing protein [Frankiaceae bacterium]|nr:DUF1800 domain-containing protein [Frankiaceae bacterium]